MTAYSGSAKIRTTITAASANAAGATNTGNAVQIGDFNPTEITAVAKITNGATGPTLPASVTLQLQIGGVWKDIEKKDAATGDAVVSILRFRVPYCGAAARLVVAGNTGQPITITEAYFLGTN